MLVNGLIGASLSCAIVLACFAFEKPRKLWRHLMYKIKYDFIGIKYLYEDHAMRKWNKTDFPKKSGRVAVITGGSRGIGEDIVKFLLKSDMEVIIGCRNVEAGKKVLLKIKEQGITSGKGACYRLDLADLASVKEFAKNVSANYEKVHVLINNAGIMFGPRKTTVDGFESQFAINYLGHFLLTHLLMPNLIAAGTKNENARIVTLSSCAHFVGDINLDDMNGTKDYIPEAAYSQAKLAVVMFTVHLNSMCQMQGIPVQVHSVHPGIVNTDLFEHSHVMPWVQKLFFKVQEEGAIPVVFAALSPSLEGVGGNYISNSRIMKMNRKAEDTIMQKKLFDFSNDTLGIKSFLSSKK